jgi:hypothetical protein
VTDEVIQCAWFLLQLVLEGIGEWFFYRRMDDGGYLKGD